MSKLYVRVNPKLGQSAFFRCGMAFTLAWSMHEDLDLATVQRLQEDQMLEVRDTPPEQEVETPAVSDGMTVNPHSHGEQAAVAPESAPVEVADSAPVEVPVATTTKKAK